MFINTARLNIELDAALHRRLKAQAALTGTTLKDLAVQALQAHLERETERRQANPFATRQ